MILESSVFKNVGEIPSRYTCDGVGVNPPLRWSDVPEGAVSLALLMDDPDIPDFVKRSRAIEVWDHWVVFNIPLGVNHVEEDSIPKGATVGLNTRGERDYGPPCPPDGRHRYVFKLYALDVVLDLTDNATKTDVEKAMQGHVVDKVELIGTYERK